MLGRIALFPFATLHLLSSQVLQGHGAKFTAYDDALAREFLRKDMGTSTVTCHWRDVHLQAGFILDTTSSFRDVLQDIKKLLPGHVEQLQSEYNDHADFALATFRDKAQAFIDRRRAFFLKRPPSNFDKAMAETRGAVEKDYCYRVVTYFNQGDLISGLKKVVAEGGGDRPENPLEAILNAATSRDNLHWSDETEDEDGRPIFRILVIATDAIYKRAGDWPERADHPNRNRPPTSCETEDYPSVAQVGEALKEKNIFPIFLVPSPLKKEYSNLINEAGTGGLVFTHDVARKDPFAVVGRAARHLICENIVTAMEAATGKAVSRDSSRIVQGAVSPSTYLKPAPRERENLTPLASLVVPSVAGAGIPSAPIPKPRTQPAEKVTPFLPKAEEEIEEENIAPPVPAPRKTKPSPAISEPAPPPLSPSRGRLSAIMEEDEGPTDEEKAEDEVTELIDVIKNTPQAIPQSSAEVNAEVALLEDIATKDPKEVTPADVEGLAAVIDREEELRGVAEKNKKRKNRRRLALIAGGVAGTAGLITLAALLLANKRPGSGGGTGGGEIIPPLPVPPPQPPIYPTLEPEEPIYPPIEPLPPVPPPDDGGGEVIPPVVPPVVPPGGGGTGGGGGRVPPKKGEEGRGLGAPVIVSAAVGGLALTGAAGYYLYRSRLEGAPEALEGVFEDEIENLVTESASPGREQHARTTLGDYA